jgi:hypothetical protein
MLQRLPIEDPIFCLRQGRAVSFLVITNRLDSHFHEWYFSVNSSIELFEALCFSEDSPMPLYRHGDLLVSSVDELPPDVKALHHLVLAEGELTGHSHRVAERDAAVLYQSASGLFLHVTDDVATLIHQEHGPIQLSTGYYHVWRQREYSPREFRFVRD